MDPYDIGALRKFLTPKVQFTATMKNDPVEYLFYGPSWLPVMCYVMRFLREEDEEAATLKNTMSDIVRLAHLWCSVRQLDEWEIEEYLLLTLLKGFVPRVQKFFKVPTKMSSCEEGTSSLSYNQNEVLAAFMDFILQIWNSEANKYDDDPSSCTVHKNKSYGLVHKGLKYMLTYLGDVPFQCCPTQLKDHFNTLLANFESVANQVGHLTFCYILSPQPSNLTESDAHLNDLLQIIELLNANIKQYCITFSELVPNSVTTSTRVNRPIDSLFIVHSLLADLEALINQRFHITIDLDMEDQIGALFNELKLSKMFLKDAKLVPRETTNDGFIVIRGIAYEAEYLINSYVVGNIPVWYLRLRLPSVIQNLKLILSRLQEIKSDDDVLQVTGDFTRKISHQPSDTSTTIVEDQLVAIEKSKNEIMDKLIGGPKTRKIISLIGMPGLGKTTLAKILFDSSSVRHHFDRRAWCVISKNYEKKKVLLDILLTLAKDDEDKNSFLVMDDECLGLKIHKSLKRNRYLIILDDIWISKTWSDIRLYFPDDSNGSRIMLTSQIKDATPTESIFPTLPFLSEVDSVDLLVKKVFRKGTCPSRLFGTVYNIARRCNGLPLGVVAIAGILANLDQKERVWEKFERDLGKFILDSQGECMKVLEFSYEHLPDYLRMCFLYLGKFPEDTKIPVRNILRLWVAEGFIEEVKEKSPEDVAKEYLHELINRSLVFVAESKFDGSIKACVLHDLLRDLCLQKADQENFMKSTGKPFSMNMRLQRMCVDCPIQSVLNHFGLHCRSFSGHLPDASQCFPQMPLHRVIDMWLPGSRWRSIEEIEGIHMLVHLRYLRAPTQYLSSDTARNLVNLEFLEISGFNINEISLSIILKMVKLKHLKVIGFNAAARIIGDSCDSSQTTNLQYLSEIKISNNPEDEKILKCSPHLQSLKCLCTKTQFPDVSSLTRLETLRVRYNLRLENISLTKVVVPLTIKKLTLKDIGFPWEEMSVIGILPNLQVLKLEWNAFVGEEWKTSDGDFQKLRCLKLYRIDGLKEWITCSEHFPELQCLVLRECNKLQGIPSDLGNIPTLQTIVVESNFYTLSKSAVQIGQEQYEMGNEELEVRIINKYWSKENLLRKYKKLKEGFSICIENDIGDAVRFLTRGRCPELQRTINDVDGTIDFPEFMELISKIRVPYSKLELQRSFKFFDEIYNRGYIESNGLCSGMKMLGHGLTLREVGKIMRDAGFDERAKLNLGEFIKVFRTIDVPRPYDFRTALLTAKTRDKRC